MPPKVKEVQEVTVLTDVQEVTRKVKPRSERVYINTKNVQTENLVTEIFPRNRKNQDTGINTHKGITKDNQEYFKYTMVTYNKVTNECVKEVYFNVFADVKGFTDEKMLKGEMRVVLDKIVEYTEGDVLNFNTDETADSDFNMAEKVIVAPKSF